MRGSYLLANIDGREKKTIHFDLKKEAEISVKVKPRFGLEILDWRDG